MPQKILVVEDHPDSQIIMHNLLNYLGYETTVASTGEEALDILRLHRFDAAVIDLALPRLDGWQLLEIIKRDDDMAAMPCIAVTAHDSSDVSMGVRGAGFKAYFPKPIDTSAFRKRLRDLIN